MSVPTPALPRLSAHQLAWPVDWPALFGVANTPPRRMILEIGFGYGVYITHLAQANPAALIVGLEIASDCIRHTEGVLARRGLRNVRLIYSAAETALHHLFTPNSISEVHINFPDPWFKRGHAKRRLMQRDTLDVLCSRLQVGAPLYLATDIHDYAKMSADLLESTPQLTNRLPHRWGTAAQVGRTVTTKYEATGIREGRACAYFAYQRNSTPALPIPVQQESAMSHCVLFCPRTHADIQVAFDDPKRTLPQMHTQGETIVKFMGAYLGRGGLLLEVYAKEPTLEQRFMFVLGARPADGAHQHVLKLASVGFPRTTPAVHLAAALLRDWLLTLHAEARVLQDKIGTE
jgi:tRNA (guanine-N7-)-methyltransferase